MPTVALAGLRGTLVEQVAALVAARTGWRIWRAEDGVQRPAERSVIYLGWEGFAPDGPQAPELRVLLVAPWELRIQRVMSEANVDEVQAAGLAAAEQRQQDARARLAGWDGCDDPRQAHLVINTARVSPEQAASLIVSAVGMVGGGSRRRRRRPRRAAASPAASPPRGQPAGSVSEPPAPSAAGGGSETPAGDDGRASPEGSLTSASPAPSGAPASAAPPPADPTAGGPRFAPVPIHHPRPAGVRPVFAHPSEEEFARMLDFYRVEWQYEPTTFPLEWDERGNVTLALTPDFYIPAWDLYVELTTMKQSLVNRKNRKIRRLKELYPHVNIKTFYGRDFERLLRKFGREGALARPAAPAPAAAGATANGRPEPPVPASRAAGADADTEAGGSSLSEGAGTGAGVLAATPVDAGGPGPAADDGAVAPEQATRDQVAAAGAGDGGERPSGRAGGARRRGRGRSAKARGGRG